MPVRAPVLDSRARDRAGDELQSTRTLAGTGARARSGESGSPSICVTRSSSTYTRCPQPTAQYGQIDWTTRSARAVRGVSDRERRDRAAARPAVTPAWRSKGRGSDRRARSRPPVSRDPVLEHALEREPPPLAGQNLLDARISPATLELEGGELVVEGGVLLRAT